MSKGVRIGIVLAVVVLFGIVVILKESKRGDRLAARPQESAEMSSAPATGEPSQPASAGEATDSDPSGAKEAAFAADASTSTAEAPAPATGDAALPRLLDLGSNKCIPCKMMAPILEELTREYAGRMIVEVIDVRENRTAAQRYGVRVIPTQIFYDPSGRELFRHEGFMDKATILAKWKELSIDLESR